MPEDEIEVHELEVGVSVPTKPDFPIERLIALVSGAAPAVVAWATDLPDNRFFAVLAFGLVGGLGVLYFGTQLRKNRAENWDKIG